jgi:hypothetical protein
MMLHLPFGGAQGDLLELLAVAVATEGLHLCPFQELHAKGHAGLFPGPASIDGGCRSDRPARTAALPASGG